MRSHCLLSRRQPFKIGGNHRSLQHQSHEIATFPPRSGGDILDANGIKYYDPQTWPKDWTAFELEGLLRGNLLYPAAKPNYESLVMLLRNGDLKSLALLLRGHVKPPPPTEVHLEQYLGESLNNTSDSAAMPLQERTEQLNSLDAALSPQPRSGVSRVVFCSSPRGSGKTQFIKWFVSQKRAEAMKYGRVIVRCCDKTAHQALSKSHKLSWVASLLENRSAGASAAVSSPSDVLCEMIRTHVEAATGADQDPSKYCDRQRAYATWMSETARCFNIPSDAHNVDPLIILDTCELLSEHDHKSLVHKSSGKPYTLLEAFCLAVPAPHAIVAIGCNAEVNATDPVYLSKANVTNIGPLRPLSEEGHEKALAESWKYEADANVRVPLHHLAGGVPRLLRLAHMKHSPTMSLASGSINAFSRCFDMYLAAARAQYPVQSQWFPQAYSCFLASSTKAKVDGSDIIPVNPAWLHGSRDPHPTLTFNEAAMCSMGLFDPTTSRFMVPPITFSDVVAAREDVPILPSQLHPFLDADVVARFGKCTSTERERLFETPLLHALYARYLLVYWADVSSPWVSLAKVLEDAVQPDQVEQLDRYEVNLSKGVKTATNDRSCVNAVSYCEDHAQSYAVVWCRLKSRSSKPFVCAIHYTRQRLESPQRHDEGGVNLKLPVQQKSLSLDLIGSSIMINASQLHQN